MTLTKAEHWLSHSLQNMANVEAEKIIVEEVKAAQDRVEQRLREMTGRFVLTILQHYRIEYNDHEIIVRVDTRALTPPAP